MNSIYELCCDGFEQKLEKQFLKSNPFKKKAYICSPYADPDPNVQVENMRKARLYMLYAKEYMGYAARAPHAYLPMLLCDSVASERAIALRFGLELLEQSDVLLVCGTFMSKGMQGEIVHAAKLGIPILVFDDQLYVKTRKLATQTGANKRLVHRCWEHNILGQDTDLIASAKGGEGNA